MFGNSKTPLVPATGLDHAGSPADQAILGTQHLAQQALDSMADGAQDLRDQATPMLHRAADQASALAHRAANAVRLQSQQLRDQAARASSSTTLYIRDEPVKSVLMAAATGAALMALISLLRSRRD